MSDNKPLDKVFSKHGWPNSDGGYATAQYHDLYEDILTWANQRALNAIDNIEQSLKSHTTPAGKDLLTRSYIRNTLDFERQKIKAYKENI
jgi:hypothetical protein